MYVYKKIFQEAVGKPEANIAQIVRGLFQTL